MLFSAVVPETLKLSGSMHLPEMKLFGRKSMTGCNILSLVLSLNDAISKHAVYIFMTNSREKTKKAAISKHGVYIYMTN